MASPNCRWASLRYKSALQTTKAPPLSAGLITMSLRAWSILFVQKMRAFRRLVLECFYKQKTTKITLNFPKIIEMHLNSSSQCIQLAMRQANKREKNQLRQREKFKFVCAHSGIEPTPLAYNLGFVPAYHHVLHGNMLIYCIYTGYS